MPKFDTASGIVRYLPPDQMLYKLKEFYEIQHTSHATLYSMEGLRGFAVFLVFLVHYMTLSEPWISGSRELHHWASLVRSLGNVGVDLFFVLSGYLIYGLLLRKERPFIPYLRRRIERIYPAFAFVFALYLILSFVFPGKSKIPRGAIAATKYVTENFLLLPGMFEIEPMITVAWSLSYEFFFYLSVPFLIFALRLRRWPPLRRSVLFIALGALIVIFPRFVGGHVRLVMFISGILVFEVCKYGRPLRQLDTLGFFGLALGLLAGIAQGVYGFSGQWKFAILAGSFCLLCWACFSIDGRASRAFRWTPLRWLGNISYSYYLVHGLVLNTVFLVLPNLFAPTGDNHWVFWLGLPLCFAVTFIVSSILFFWVEKPYSLTVKT